jgi:hypothetical protein
MFARRSSSFSSRLRQLLQVFPLLYEVSDIQLLEEFVNA